MDASLQIIGGPMAEQIVPVQIGKLVIGRADDCDLRAISDLISRYHCVVLLDEYTLRVRDLGSRNGTSVSGRRIGTGGVILLDGDTIEIGELVLKVLIQQTIPETPAVDGEAMKGTGFFDGETLAGLDPAEKPSTPAPDLVSEESRQEGRVGNQPNSSESE